MEVYLDAQTKLTIPETDQPRFKENVREDIILISPARLVGLGVTVDELTQWQNKFRGHV